VSRLKLPVAKKSGPAFDRHSLLNTSSLFSAATDSPSCRHASAMLRSSVVPRSWCAGLAFGSIAALTSLSLRARAAARRAAATIATYPDGAPKAAKRPVAVTFGVSQGQFRGEGAMDPPLVHTDPYFWMRDEAREDPGVLAQLRAENAYTAASMAHLEKLREALFEEQRGHIRETETTAPYRHGPFMYYRRTEEGKSYTIYCRRAMGT